MNEHTYNFPHPAVTTDCVVFGFDGVRLHVLLIERADEPYKGCWAFPGGFLRIDEDAPDGARRHLQDETGLTVTSIEQLGAFTAPDRDPRERVISVAFFALVRIADADQPPVEGKGRWFPVKKIPPLAFDHEEIFNLALQRMSNNLRLKTGNFLNADFAYEETDMIYYATLPR